MLPVSLSPETRRWAAIGAGALAVLVIAGLVTERFARPAQRTESRSVHTEQARTVAQVDTEARSALQLLSQQLAETQARLQQSERRQSDVVTNRETIRYLAPPGAPTSAPAPVVVLRDGAPSPAAPDPTTGQLVEIIRETIADKSRIETDTQRTEQARTESQTQTSAQGETQTSERTETTEQARTETSEKTEPVAAASPAESNRLGVGYSTGGPFASYDLASAPLGPKQFGLGRLSAGLFVTKSGAGIDGGPQVNYTPGKSNLFGMVGYQVKARTPIVGVGIRF